MVGYRRNRVPGGTYFFTITLKHRNQALLVDHIDCLRDSIRDVLRKNPFHIDAWVVLPEHMHALLTLPAGDLDYSGRIRHIKSRFTRLLAGSGVVIQKNTRREYDVWQPRFWEHTIRDELDYAHHVEYIHYNPVKHGYVQRVRDWPFSTFHRYVRSGVVDIGWGDDFAEITNYGEPP